MRTIKKHGQVFEVKCSYWGVGGTIHRHFCSECKQLTLALNKAKKNTLTSRLGRTFTEKAETIFFAALPFAVLLFFVIKDYYSRH